MTWLPQIPLRFARELTLESRVVEPTVLQAHVIKHPFGMGHLLRSAFGPPRDGKRRWDHEGWHATVPPVLVEAERERLTRDIRTLELAGQHCRVPRLESTSYGGESLRTDEECYACPSALVAKCLEVSGAVGDRYAQVATDVLKAVADPAGQIIDRTELVRRVLHRSRDVARLLDLTVLCIGRVDARRAPRLITRLTRGDGVVVDLFLDGRRLKWRTTFRRPAARGGVATFLLEFLEQVPGLPMSEKCIVPRLWIEKDSK